MERWLKDTKIAVHNKAKSTLKDCIYLADELKVSQQFFIEEFLKEFIKVKNEEDIV